MLKASILMSLCNQFIFYVDELIIDTAPYLYPFL